MLPLLVCIGFSQWIKREFGDYPTRQMLVKLAKISEKERKEDTWFGLYLWEKGGYKVKYEVKIM